MRLAIRFADKIVGLSIMLALGIVIFVLFMLGTNQRWFARDYVFYAYFQSAVGLSPNMAVQHRGFPIGQVRTVRLTEDDRVEVRFVIFDTYLDRARVGSLVELVTGPIPVMGNQFLFFPGLAQERLQEGARIPLAGSPEAEQLVAMGIAAPLRGDDGIGSIIENVGSLLYVLNEALEGTDRTALGRTMLNLEASVASIQQAAESLSVSIVDNLELIVAQLEPTLAGIRALSEEISDPDGAVMAILDGEGDVYANLVSSLEAISGTLRNLEITTGYIPAQLPQVTAILIDLQMVLRTAEDVLVALTNNPLLRRGVPDRRETGPGGTFARDLEF